MFFIIHALMYYKYPFILKLEFIDVIIVVHL
jgi:hypothetical protein